MRMPDGWNYRHKRDLKNIVAIQRAFGREQKLKTFPKMGLGGFLRYVLIDGIKWIHLLDHVTYQKEEATRILEQECGWRPYEKKHYESVFTRFYQGCILPEKCGVDKRRLHFSTLIASDQMRRDDALQQIEQGTYEDQDLLAGDREYVLKKLGFSEEEFEKYLSTPCVPHTAYPSNSWAFGAMRRLMLLGRGRGKK
jgi:hypothetical protein